MSSKGIILMCTGVGEDNMNPLIYSESFYISIILQDVPLFYFSPEHFKGS